MIRNQVTLNQVTITKNQITLKIRNILELQIPGLN